MSDNEKQIIFPQPSENELDWDFQIDKVLEQRLGHLPDEYSSALPELDPREDYFYLYDYLPSIPLKKLVRTQIESRYFRWVNRGRVIGIEVNPQYYMFLIERGVNYHKKIKKAVLEWAEAIDNTTIWNFFLDSTRNKKAFAESEYYKIVKEHDEDQHLIHLKAVNKTVGNFIPITTIPETVPVDINDKGKIILTYSFPKIGNLSTRPFKPSLIAAFKQVLSDNPYIDFLYIDEEETKTKAAIQIVQSHKKTSNRAFTKVDNAFSAQPVIIVLPAQMDSLTVLGKDVDMSDFQIDTFLHELIHALGLPHHWDAFAALDAQGNLKNTIKKTTDNEDKKLVKRFRKDYFTPYQQTLPDSWNEAYNLVRDIKNQTIRAGTGGVLSVLYQVKDPYPKGVVFKFVPEGSKKNYTVHKSTQEDGVQIVTYGGRISGITISNPGDDFTDLDFRQVPAFSDTRTYNGVDAVLALDASISFESYVYFQPKDKNISIDLYTKNLRKVYLSSYNDKIWIDKIYQNVEIYPGLGDDLIFTLNNTKVIVDRYEDKDTIDVRNGGTIELKYDQDKLNYYKDDSKWGTDIYLVAYKDDNLKDIHGACLKYYKRQNDLSSVIVKDVSGQIIDLKNKKFLDLPVDLKW